MKTFLFILLGMPFSFLGACEQQDFHSTVFCHYMMYETLFVGERTHDPILLKTSHDKDIFYSGCQYALENLFLYQEESVKNTR